MIKIISDTLSSITPEEAKALNIALLPQIIHFGDKTYRDDYEITPEEFLLKLKESKELPKTSAPWPELYRPIFEEALKTCDTILCLLPSEKISGTFRGATLGTKYFPDADIRIFDTESVAPIQGTMTKLAKQWVDEGQDIDIVLAKLDDLKNRQKSIFVVDTLEYLYKNGRIGGAKNLFGSILEIKPILKLENGAITALESQRTQKRAIIRMKELVVEQYPKVSSGHLTITHAGVPHRAKKIASELKELLTLENEIPIYNLPPAIMVHVGPGAIAVQFFSEK